MKKHLFLALLLFTALQSLIAQKDPGDVNVIVKSGEISLGKKNNIADDWNVQDGISYLGGDVRVRGGFNKTRTYDNIGVVLFESMVDSIPTGKISEIQIHFSIPAPNNVTPKTGFTGTLKIEKFTITSSSSFETLKSELEGYAETESYLEHSHRLAKDGLYIYFQYDKTDTQLIKVSVGQDKRGNKK